MFMTVEHGEKSSFYTTLGLECLQNGQLEEAVEKFNIALKYASGNLAAWVNLGTALQRMGRFEEAIDIAESILRQNWPLGDEQLGMIYYIYGNIYREMGNKKDDKEIIYKAIERYMKAIEKRPNHASTWFNLGQCYLKLGELKKASEAYERTLEINPGHTDARDRLEMLGKWKSDGELENAEKIVKSPKDDY